MDEKITQKSERFYVNNKNLYDEILKWRDSAEEVKDRIISEELAKMIMLIAKRMTNHSNFRNYPEWIKEEMISSAVYKVITNSLKNYNFAFKNPFGYITRACWNDFIGTISKYYKQINIKKKLLNKHLTDYEGLTNMINGGNSVSRNAKNYLGYGELDYGKD